MDRGGWQAYSPWGHKRVRHDLATKQQQGRARAKDGPVPVPESPALMEEGERAENIAATCERPSPSMSLCDFLFREHLIRDRSEIWLS